MIYLKNKETNEILNSYNNVLDWGYDFVEYVLNKTRIKRYCGENEYFTDVEVEDGNE